MRWISSVLRSYCLLCLCNILHANNSSAPSNPPTIVVPSSSGSAPTAGSQQAPRPVVRGYVTNQAQPIVSAGAVATCAPPATSGCSLTGGYDYNPQLLGGTRGAAGIKARLNQRGFQYASDIIAPILNAQIKKARIPNVNQCIPEVNGCVQVYNIYVSRYRCPQRIVLYPSPPNQIVLAVENVDIGVTGNLAGQINILVPIALFGIVQVNVHQVSLRVSLTITRGPSGGVNIGVVGCQVTVGYVDAYIQNGGLVGDIANSQFRGQISSTIRKMLPSQVCNQLPSIVNEQLNSKLTIIPQSIALSQLLQTALSAFGLNSLIGGGQCPSSCSTKKAAAAAAQKGPLSALSPPQLPQQVPAVPPPLPLPRPTSGETSLQVPPVRHSNTHLKNGGNAGTSKGISLDKSDLELLKTPKQVSQEKAQSLAHFGSSVDTPRLVLAPQHQTLSNGTRILQRNNRVFPTSPLHFVSSGSVVGRSSTHLLRQRAGLSSSVTVSGERLAAPAPHAKRQKRQLPATPGFPSPNHVVFADPNSNVCANCPSGGAQNPLSFLTVVLQSLDFSKLSNIYLTVQLLQTYASTNDFTVELNGEFSPQGQGGTPFGAFPMFFPQPVGHKMAEILISDFTVNSLFYHLHRVGFLTVRIGPETPKIGDLLKTTCSSGEEEEALEDHGVETDEAPASPAKGKRKRRDLTSNSSSNSSVAHRRLRRQDGTSALSDLGICFGDILPSVRERYPNQKIVVVIRTARAPSVVLSSRNGGTASLDFVLDADFYIEATNQKVGTIQVAATVDFTVRTGGQRISARADISRLQLRDVGNSLGLPQDALDNLGTLGKEVILKAGNDALEKGTSVAVPSGVGGLPINLVDPEIQILEHALHIGFDFTVNPSALESLVGGGGGTC